MNSIVFWILIFSSPYVFASKKGDEKASQDLKFNVEEVEIDLNTVEGEGEYCPVGLVHWKNVEDQLQFWIGERFYLMNFNAGDIRIEGEDEPGCYRIVKTETQKVLGKSSRATRYQSLYCRNKVDASKIDKIYENTTDVWFEKKSIRFNHEYTDYTKLPETKGKFKCDLVRVEAATAKAPKK